jgi:hypothetical protein
MDHVQEFLSPNFHEPLPFKYLLLFLIAVLARSRPTVNWIQLILILMFTYMALYSVRYITLFVIIVGPILIRLIDQMKQDLPTKVRSLLEERSLRLLQIDGQTSGYLWSLIAIFAVVTLGAAGSYQYAFSEKSYPVSAVEFLKKENVAGNTFTDDDFGDYLIYAAWPQHRVFIDGRTDMYGPERIKEYLTLAHVKPGWKEVVNKYAFSSVLFATHSPLASALAEDQTWHLIYSDPLASIFLKKDGRNRRLVDKYPHPALSKGGFYHATIFSLCIRLFPDNRHCAFRCLRLVTETAKDHKDDGLHHQHRLRLLEDCTKGMRKGRRRIGRCGGNCEDGIWLNR